MKMALRLWILIMHCVGMSCVEAEVTDAAGSTALSWSLSSEAFENQPNWDPRNEEIPLPPHAAVKAATSWLLTQGKTTNDLRVGSIDLRRFQESKWVYWVRFATGQGAAM